MSSNNKRCSSGILSTAQTQSLVSFQQHATLSRSKTCSFTSPTTSRSKPERLQPLVTNKNSQLNNEALPDDVDNLHPAMVSELCLHTRGLSTIPSLSQFSKLQILDLSCNNLIRIENLKNLSNLRELKLYGNKIERIENLECLTQLQILQLQFNEIQSIGLGLICLTRLQSLRIDSNKLSIIKPEEVLKLAQLKILDISNCTIEHLDFINTLSSIVELRACHCNLKILPNQFRNLRNLIDVDLSNNELNNIASLKTLLSLRILRLANNHIQDIQVISFLVHLNELDLSNNKINSLPNSFEKLIDLQCLNVSHNRINSWNNISVLHHMSSLFILNLNGNSLLSQVENFIEKVSELCPTLEVINDISLKTDDSTANPSASDEQLMSIDKELKEVDQTLEKSIAVIQAQFDVIFNDLQKLNTSNHDSKQDKELMNNNFLESNDSNKKSMHRLFQALTFSEENYQSADQETNDV
ncbi:unnamed protein product [Rotaria socialis]|uniref:Disease resistance R13L4/SHOC-2-like LRR domain-containing protein n=1 Tax=Rotaria socialis TaxID=392032 RepID=A0A817YHT7_9BILA|nr:unnamed protein product [Rotaria socialis]CAF3442673.1 unnamed protein product [Rotaria socialis]CAF4325635.1 unnamed protein product [Rotaria socialis]CAF4339544.1 unnamed protein product [Rotaria socialis]